MSDLTERVPVGVRERDRGSSSAIAADSVTAATIDGVSTQGRFP